MESDSAHLLKCRYVQEIDSLQRKYAEQIMELQGMLNQSDQVKRELEAQVMYWVV